MRRLLPMIAALAMAAPGAAAAPRCAMTPAERAWIDQSLAAWTQVSTGRLNLEPHREPTIVVFDAKCRFEKRSGSPTWRAEPHNGSIRIPDGNRVPAAVTSFAGSDNRTGTSFFVMALPSVWQAAKIPIAADPKGLTGVFLHEFSHTRQVEPLKRVFAAAEAMHSLDGIDDDSLQGHFRDDPIYVAVIEKELDLLYRAAAEPNAVAARKLAGEALTLMEARQKRWFVGANAYWKNIDDLFLTMEGFGQWVAYSWLADPRGGGLGPTAARDKMRGNRKWWSQELGLPLFLVIDRFVPDWPKRAFAENPALGIDLLRLAASDGPRRAP